MSLPVDLPVHERPRERLLRHGPGSLRDAELLALALRTGTRGRSAIDMGNLLMQHYGGLRGLFSASPDELMTLSGLGAAKACSLAAVLELARRATEEQLTRQHVLSEPSHVKQYFRTALGHRTVEHCIALYLDNQLNLIATGELARGTLNQASVYPREVVREALRHHAAAIILAHNHPSGIARPSDADLRFTTHLRQALALVDVRLVDHLIVAGHQVVSMAELGMM
ncbi:MULTISPECIES: DNA repair protein RadC [unclassified Bordetella]|uniref:RadC family protein n=1 Tax=unclassified Bordetella TaxID=2630031 RepID=UPI0013266CC4|nr:MULTISPECIES: DNA repair protein RadC [unclassified Bordetella]MVW73040.1 DNA repair protein RadC [Bordetella sp. 15P40C-2]MVW80307.1 DNA repair protein RadC [Bordetella sp. 02P26C-1]